jgi:hypothetical protein
MKILSNYVCMHPSQNFASENFFNLLWTCHYDLFQLEYLNYLYKSFEFCAELS